MLNSYSALIILSTKIWFIKSAIMPTSSPANFTISDVNLVCPSIRKIFCYRPEILATLLEASVSNRARKNWSPAYGFDSTRPLNRAPYSRTNQTKNITWTWSGSICNFYVDSNAFLLIFITKCKKAELNKTLHKTFWGQNQGANTNVKIQFLFTSENCFNQWNMFKVWK